MSITIYTRAAKGAPLTNDEQDQTIINLKTAIETLSGGGVKVVGFSQDPDNGDLTIKYSDGTSVGPIILPRQPVSVRGAWGTGRPYAAGDLVTYQGSAYIVAENHVAGAFAGDLAAGRLVLLAAKGESGGFEDAPEDGKVYGRADGEWAMVLGEAPADGKSYVRKASAWSASADLPEAPKDGGLYARKDGAWTAVVTSGIQHASANDGKYYASKDGGWATFTPGIVDAPNNANAYVRKGGAWVVAASGGGTGNVRERGEWSASTSYEKNDLVVRNGVAWLARDTYYTQAPAPAFAEGGYWIAMGFPTGDIGESLTSRLQHQFSTAHENRKRSVYDILNDLETRLKAAETKLAGNG